MAGEDGFLSRWSRLSRAEKRKPTTSAEGRAAPEPASSATQSPETAGGPAAAPEPEFDVSTLPSIEDVSLETDVSVFLRKGVPEALKNAALRKAWALDPAIRDYIGPVENGWDFNDPESIPGFGFLKPDFDAGAMMRQITGEKSPQEILDATSGLEDVPVSEASTVLPDTDPFTSGELVSARPPEGKPGKDRNAQPPKPEISRSEDGTPQHDPTEDAEQNPVFPNKRRHGGAMPL